MNINLLDAGFAIVLLLFLVRGLLRGMVQEIAGLVGLFAGFFFAGKYYTYFVPQMRQVVTDPDWAAIASYAAVFVAALIVVALMAAIVRKFMNLTFTAWLDHLLGAVVGAGKGVLLCSIALALMARLVPGSPFLKDSLLAAHIGQITQWARSLLPAFL